jgi:hypothetical protein
MRFFNYPHAAINQQDGTAHHQALQVLVNLGTAAIGQLRQRALVKTVQAQVGYQSGLGMQAQQYPG